MEPAKKQVRAIWPLLKARVTTISETGIIIGFGSEYGSPTTIKIAHDMRGYDVKEGDLLTLYTEVLLAKPQGEA